MKLYTGVGISDYRRHEPLEKTCCFAIGFARIEFPITVVCFACAARLVHPSPCALIVSLILAEIRRVATAAIIMSSDGTRKCCTPKRSLRYERSTACRQKFANSRKVAIGEVGENALKNSVKSITDSFNDRLYTAFQ